MKLSDKKFLKVLALKGLILGFSERKKVVYAENEDQATVASNILQEYGLGEYQVEVIGKVSILGVRRLLPFVLTPVEVKKTEKIRPLKCGISIGHRDITAGTLGAFVEAFNKICILDCAHVLHPYPLSAFPPTNKEVCQPGPYDFGFDYSKVPEYHVANYTWHLKIWSIYERPTCPTTMMIDKLYRLFGRESEFIILQKPNHLDTGMAGLLPDIEYEPKLFSTQETPQDPFIGLLFAGSTQGHGVICKVNKYLPKHISYKLIGFKAHTGDDILNKWVYKDGRTSCLTEAIVIDDRASIMVSYYYDLTWFEDVIITSSALGAKGGDSGSPVFLKK